MLFILQTIPGIRNSNYFRRPTYLKVMTGKFATDSVTFWRYTVLWACIIFGKCCKFASSSPTST